MLDLDTRKPLYVILLSDTKAASADLDLSSQAKQIILPGHFRRRAKYNTRNFFDKSRSQLRKKYGSTSSSLSARQIAANPIFGERLYANCNHRGSTSRILFPGQCTRRLRRCGLVTTQVVPPKCPRRCSLSAWAYPCVKVVPEVCSWPKKLGASLRSRRPAPVELE